MNYLIKRICCIGAGYVGGPTMAVIADRCPELQVNVVDINKKRIAAWNSRDLSKLPIYEPGLPEVISRCRGVNLHFSSSVEDEIEKADMIFLSVNTPTKTKGFGAGQASNLKWVESSARQVAKFAKGLTIVVEKSTLPVKTAETIKSILEASLSQKEEELNKKQFTVLSNPEFLAEGTAINDLENPDRVLIGGEDQEAIEALENIYLNWIKPEKILRTNLWSSELSKLTANAFLAQRISSINSISALCEATGADINQVSKAIGMDHRIGLNFLKAGPGFGGSCFKKDILNLVYLSNYYGLKEVAKYWQEVVNLNQWQRDRIPQIVVKKLFGTLNNKKLAVLGFSFKENTNDTRESPAIDICKSLIEEGAKVAIYDPKVPTSQIVIDLGINQEENIAISKEDGGWKFYTEILEAVKEADAILILTEWAEFKNIKWKEVASSMRTPSWLFDCRNISNYEEIDLHGINLWRLGIDEI